MYLSTATTVIPLLPGLPQSIGASGYSEIKTLVTSHVRRAEQLVMAKAARRYDLSGYTITTAPPLLKMITEDIASYYTYRSEFSSDNQNANEWTDKFDEAGAILTEIMEGTFDLVDTAGSIITTRSTGADAFIVSNTENYTPTFGEDSLTSWKVDPDKINDIGRD